MLTAGKGELSEKVGDGSWRRKADTLADLPPCTAFQFLEPASKRALGKSLSPLLKQEHSPKHAFGSQNYS